MNDHLHRVTESREIDPLGLLERWRIAMLSEGMSPDTVRLRVGAVRLAARFAGKVVHELTRGDYQAWLATHTNQNTLMSYFNSASVWQAFLLAEGVRDEDPTARMRRPRKPRGTPRPCSTETLYALLDAALTGRKGGVVATLPLHEAVAELVPDMPSRGFWFPSTQRRDAPVRPAAVTRAVQRAAQRAGLSSSGAHELRHWFGTWLVRSGADLRTAQTLLRHAALLVGHLDVDRRGVQVRVAILRLPGLPDGGAR